MFSVIYKWIGSYPDATEDTEGSTDATESGSESPSVRAPKLPYYIGAHTKYAVANVLKPTVFALFYELPSHVYKYNKLPRELPLKVAYKATNGMLYCFELEREYIEDCRGGYTKYRVRTEKTDMAWFTTLDALVEYHNTYASLTSCGVDVFEESTDESTSTF